MRLFLCSTMSRFSVPTAIHTMRRAQLPSRIASATAERGAEGVLDGSEHGAMITRSGDTSIQLCHGPA
jgi:hypothetical protein